MVDNKKNTKDIPARQNQEDALVHSDPDVIRRVEIMCELFDVAYEIKFLELKRRHPEATDEWIKQETLRLIEIGTR